MGTSNYFLSYEGVAKYILMQQESEASASAQKWAGQFIRMTTCPECNGQRLNKEALHYKIAGKNIAESNVRSCFNVIAVFNGACQIAADVFNGGDGVHIAHKVGEFGDITFKAVAERVKALISSVMCRYAFHQFRVFNAQYGEQVRCFQSDFFVGFGVGNDASGVGFAAGACGGADGNPRKYGTGFSAH